MGRQLVTTVERFIRRFRGRGDVKGHWDGRCVREPLTPDDFARHLERGPHIGVYPLMGSVCSWGCVDIDTDDYPLAIRLQASLAYKMVPSHIERTRRGWHVWVFPEDDLVVAATMRRALMAACAAIGYDPKEVNPKQEQLSRGQVGNYVRLPYPGGLVGTPEQRVFVVNGKPLTLHEALHQIDNGLCPTSALTAISRLWQPPAPVNTVIDVAADDDVKQILKRCDGLAFTVWRDGPLPGSDRSTTLFRLAAICKENDLNAQDAFMVVRSADARWGKFSERKDRDARLSDIVERAFR